MANIKFTEFPSATVVGSMDIIPIVQSGVNKKTTAAIFQTYLSSNFVPYTGATTDLNLDTFDLYTAKVWLKDVPNDGFGSLELTDGVLHFEDVDGHSMVTMEDGYLTIANASTIRALLDVSALSANRDFAFPNASGTLALTSQLTSGTVTSVAALTLGTTGTDLSSSVANGTTTPVITLNVPTASATNRGALSSADWTTFNNKQNALTNPITGTGTTNYLPKFTGASALGNSTIFDNGSNVYLNTTTGTYRFEANAGSSQYINARFYGSSHSLLQIESTTAGFQALFSFKSPTRIWSMGLQGDGKFNIYDNTANAERFTITSAGNVGIGITTPSEKLEVQNAAAGAKIKVSNSGGGYATLECSSNATSVAQLSFTNQLSLTGGNVFLSNGLTASGEVSAVTRFRINPTTQSNQIIGDGTASNLAGANNLLLRNDSGSIFFASGSANVQMLLNTSGNLLLGTTTDAGFKLDVNGTARVTSNTILNNIGWGGVTPIGDGGNCSTIEGTNGAQIAARNGFAQLYIGSNVVGTPYAATRSVAGYATQLSLDALGGTISLNRAVSGAAGSAISWISNLGFDNTGAATFTSNVTANSFIKSGGTSAQFLKANGSVDSSTFVGANYGYSVPMTQTGDWMGMTTSSGISGWTHVINIAWDATTQNSWVSQIAFAAQTGTGAYYRTTSGAITSASWVQLIDGNNIGGYLSGYLPLSGGTLTGDLTVNTKIYVGTHGCYLQEVLVGGVYELQVVDSVGNRTILS